MGSMGSCWTWFSMIHPFFHQQKKHSNLQNNIFSNIFRDFLQKSVYIVYIYIRCDVPRSKLRTKHQVPHQHPKVPWIVDSRGQDPPDPKSPEAEVPTSLTWGTAKSMIKLPGGIIASKKKTNGGGTPWDENEKEPTPRIQLLLRSFC